MRSYKSIVLAVIPVATLLLVGLAIASGGAEGKTVYDQDLLIDTTTVMSSDTFEVHGNVTVNAPATLTLRNAVLVLVGDTNGSRTLGVEPGASLIGDSSTIRGSPWTIALELNGSVTLDDCILENLWGANGSYGVLVGGFAVWNTVIVRDGPNGTGVKVTGDLLATDCEFKDLGDTLVDFTQPTAAGTSQLTRCSFEPASSATGTTIGVSYRMPAAITVDTTLFIRDCTFTGLEYGVLAQVNTTSASLSVTGTRFDECDTGVLARGNRATIIITDCIAMGMDGPVGFHVYSISSSETALNLTCHHLVVDLYTKGIYIQGPVHGFRPTLHHVNVTNCEQGISSMGTTVLVEDSNVTDCTWCFYAETKARIEVRRTVHEHGSGRNAPGEQAAIVAFTTVNVTSAKWKGAHAITEGSLSLVGDDGMELERIDLADPQAREVVAWSVTKFNRLGRLWIYPTISVDGEEFQAANFSIYDTSPHDVELIDHLPPEISDVWPADGQWFATSEVNISGHVADKGSGLQRMVVRFVGGQQVVVGADGNWSVEFLPVTDGTYSLELNASDVTGGSSVRTIADLHVDTVMPAIALDNETVLTNRTEVSISGTTEPQALVHIWALSILPKHPFTCEDNVTADEEGRFGVTFVLPEGRQEVALRSTDRAGNFATASFVALIDTVAPVIVIDTPRDQGWYNGSPLVTGRVTDEGVSERLWAWIWDTPVYPRRSEFRQTGGFEFLVPSALAVDGDLTITIRAEDEAGNAAEASVTVHIDRTPPVLTVDTPRELRFFTTEIKINLQGRLEETNLDQFTLNGYPMGLLEDIFTDSLQILEGENVFTLYAVDMAGNEDEVTIVILRDLIPPTYAYSASMVDGTEIEIDGKLYGTYPGPGLPRVEMTFNVSEWSRVTGLGGLGQVEGEGALTIFVDLVEGPNSFTFSIVDEVGNQGTSVTYAIILDTTPPGITVEGPNEGIVTKDHNHRILGRVEVGSTLTLDGKAVPVNTDGTFNVQVDLEVGVNTFNLEAVDKVGLEGNLTVTITREKESDDGPGMGAAVATVGLVVAAVLASFTAVRRRT